jgi:hypothetical protein
MIAGQLFRLWVTARVKLEGRTVVHDKQMLMVAADVDDARTRFPYVFDLSDFDDYAIVSVEKETSRCVVVSSTSRTVEHQDPDAVIKRADRSDNVWQPAPQCGHKFMVAAWSFLLAHSEKHAQRKMFKRLSEGDERANWLIEEQFLADGFAKARDVSVFTKAHIINLPRSVRD